MEPSDSTMVVTGPQLARSANRASACSPGTRVTSSAGRWRTTSHSLTASWLAMLEGWALGSCSSSS
ncbi:hypothetical protein D3C78_1780310 [compost metagenome]